MTATLYTRCGCSRTMQIPYPANPRILVPLRPERSLFHMMEVNDDDDISKPSLGVRTFELYAQNGNTAEYIESTEHWNRR